MSTRLLRNLQDELVDDVKKVEEGNIFLLIVVLDKLGGCGRKSVIIALGLLANRSCLGFVILLYNYRACYDFVI